MNKFKKGDIITGTTGNTYGITTCQSIIKVVANLKNGGMRVKVLSHKEHFCQRYIGRTYSVAPKYFKKIPKLKAVLLSEDV